MQQWTGLRLQQTLAGLGVQEPPGPEDIQQQQQQGSLASDTSQATMSAILAVKLACMFPVVALLSCLGFPRTCTPL